MLESRPGLVIFRACGKGASEAFRHEPGGHRWQRVPPTEKRGRVHTSTVTVAVLPEAEDARVALDERDLEWKACRGSGAGGQHRQKNDTAVQLTHLPTGLQVRCEAGRSQHQNRLTALALLRARLLAEARDRIGADRDQERRTQVGSGMRGDKVRTVALQRDQVTDHRTGRTMSARRYLRGELGPLRG